MIYNLSNSIKLIFASLTVALSSVFGGFDLLFKALLFCMTADYITGLLCAVYEKKLNSKTGFKGIIKKAVILIIVAISVMVSITTNFSAIRNMVIGFYIANESLSILENAAKMNIPVFNKLKDILEQLKNENDK